MALWRVQVGGVSHRYVDAESAQAAVEAVRETLLVGLDLAATPADALFTETYEASGPLRRKRMLAALDGLTSPHTKAEVGLAKRRLTKLLQWSDETAKWARTEVAKSPPPPDPTVIEQMVRRIELDHVERQRRLLRQANVEIRPYNDA